MFLAVYKHPGCNEPRNSLQWTANGPRNSIAGRPAWAAKYRPIAISGYNN